MSEKREIIAIIGAAITLIIAGLFVYWGLITMPMFSSAIAYVLAIAFVGWLVWGFKPRITRLLKRQDKPMEKSSKATNEKAKQELNLLISPLHAKLNADSRIVDFMAMYCVTRLNTYKDDATRTALETLEKDIKEVMLQYGTLASEQLHTLITEFQDLKPEVKQRNGPEARRVLLDIKKMVKERQNELRTELKKSN